MHRASTTLLLAGALSSACSKPNPLFLDTAGGVSEGGSQADTEGSSGGVDTATPTTTTTGEPTTGAVATGTVSSEPMTSSGPTSGTTGGQDFFCQVDPMTQCCDVMVPVEADNFFSDAVDGAGQPGCPFAPNPPPGFEMLACGDWSFGTVKELRIFNDFDGMGNLDPIKHHSFMALRFPMKGGELVLDGDPVPWAVVSTIKLQMPASVRWDLYDGFLFGFNGLPADQAWGEGDPQFTVPVPCKDGNSSYYCLECAAMPGACATDWTGLDPIQVYKGDLFAAEGDDLGLLEFVIPEPAWIVDSPGGLVLVPDGAAIGMSNLPFVPSGAIVAKARESGSPARLKLTLCQP